MSHYFVALCHVKANETKTYACRVRRYGSVIIYAKGAYLPYLMYAGDELVHVHGRSWPITCVNVCEYV